MTETRAKFIKLLSFIQNSPEFANQDILTFSAFLDDGELAEHIIRMAGRVSKGRQIELHDMMRRLRASSN